MFPKYINQNEIFFSFNNVTWMLTEFEFGRETLGSRKIGKSVPYIDKDNYLKVSNYV